MSKYANLMRIGKRYFDTLLILRDMKNNILLIAFIIFAIFSCKKENTNVFCGEYKEITDIGTTIELKPHIIVSEDSLLAANDITVIGDRILITSLDNKECVFQLYDMKGHLITTFGKIGRTENEFTEGTIVTDQLEGNDIYINDVNSCMLKVLNLDSVMQSKQNIVKKTFKTTPRTLNAFCVNDTLLIYEQETLDNYRFCMENTCNSFKYPYVDLYKPCQKPSEFYQSKMSFNKEHNMIVAAMRNNSQINFYNIKSGNRHSIKILRGDMSSKMNGNSNHEFYCDISTNSQYIYALYMNQSSEDAYEKEKRMEIHVFNWNGDYIKCLETTNYIIRISVDEKNEWLYALDLNSNVYKYLLNNI